MNVEKTDKIAYKIAYKIERFSSLPSTSDYAKQKRALGENLIVVAESQSGGRGTKGRSFSSARGGVYLSALTFYHEFPAERAFEIMQNTAVAVCETLACYGVKAQIKWPNDIFVNGKKICGILMENTLSGRYILSSIVGVGINVCNELEAELSKIATSIYAETGKRISPRDVEETFVGFLQKELHEKYEKYLGFIGETAIITHGESKEKVVILGVDETGNLVAETSSGVCSFASAEVSLLPGVEV